MTCTWWMPSTWWGEDLGRARRISDYSFFYSSLPNSYGDPAAYQEVACKIQKPDGSYARTKVKSVKHRTKDELRIRLQEEIRKRYPTTTYSEPNK